MRPSTFALIIRSERGGDVVRVLIDGDALDEKVARQGHGIGSTRASALLWPGHRIWLGEQAPSDEFTPDGKVIVAFGPDDLVDSGIAANITTGTDTVTWDDFVALPAMTRIRIGPFTFDRHLYEAEIDRASRAVRR